MSSGDGGALVHTGAFPLACVRGGETEYAPHLTPKESHRQDGLLTAVLTWAPV